MPCPPAPGLRRRHLLITAGPHPCLIFVRGGNRDFGALDDKSAVFFVSAWAAQGYAVVASQLRGGGGSEGHDEFGGADTDDLLALLPPLDAWPDADASRIGLLAWSRDGLMACLMLARTQRIRATAIGAGDFDAEDLLRHRPEFEQQVMAPLIPLWKQQRQAALWKQQRQAALWARSPVRRPERLSARAPVLLLHGSGDPWVCPTQSLDRARVLMKAGRLVRLQLHDGDGHAVLANRSEVNQAVLQWLHRYVRDRAPLPELRATGP